MPFYIFKISPDNSLEALGSEEKYRPARNKVRDLRAAAAADGSTIRMIFASTEAQGAKLLTSSAHDDRVIGDD
jgi:hypothetical protein